MHASKTHRSLGQDSPIPINEGIHLKCPIFLPNRSPCSTIDNTTSLEKVVPRQQRYQNAAS